MNSLFRKVARLDVFDAVLWIRNCVFDQGLPPDPDELDKSSTGESHPIIAGNKMDTVGVNGVEGAAIVIV